MPNISTRTVAASMVATDWFYGAANAYGSDFQIQRQNVFGQDLTPFDQATFTSIKILDAGNSTSAILTTTAADVLECDRSFTTFGDLTWGAPTSGGILSSDGINRVYIQSTSGHSLNLRPDNTTSIGTGLTLATSSFVGVGVEPSAKLHVEFSTEQLRLGYDATSIASFTVSAAGALTIAPTTSTTFTSGSESLLWTGNSTNPFLKIVSSSGHEAYMQATASGLAAFGAGTNIPLVFTVNSTEVARFDTSGNFGIDTTPLARTYLSAGTHNLSMSSSVGNLCTQVIDSSDQRLTLGSYWESGVGQYSYIQSTDNAETSFGFLLLNPAGGNVGIGTDVPSDRLDVRQSGNCTVKIQGTDAAFLRMADSGATVNNRFTDIISDAGNWIFRQLNDDGINPTTSKRDAMIIGNTGDVIIGTSGAGGAGGLTVQAQNWSTVFSDGGGFNLATFAGASFHARIALESGSIGDSNEIATNKGLDIYTNSSTLAMSFYTAGGTGIGVSTAPTGTASKVLMFGDNAGNPTPATNTAGIFAKDVSGSVEMFAVNEAGDIHPMTGSGASGSYTPTFTPILNITASSEDFENNLYQVIGDIVSVTGACSFSLSSSVTQFTFRVSLPVASNLTDTFDLVGVATAFQVGTPTNRTFIELNADPTSDEAIFVSTELDIATSGDILVQYEFKYVVK